MPLRIERSLLNRLPFDLLAEAEKFRQALLEHRFTLDPAPAAPELIDRAITRVQTDGQPDDFVVDVDIIEDVLPPTPVERKAEMLGRLRKAEAEALAAVISPARERLLALDMASIPPLTTPEDKPSAADLAIIDRYNDIAAQKRRVHRHFVAQEIELEDLPEASIDDWTIKPFAS